jgi:arginine-tRNA-protein transferase
MFCNRVIKHTQDLVSWDGSSLRDPHTAKSLIGELVAGIGPEAAWQIVVELG